MPRKNKILFFYNYPSSFVRKDIEILEGEYEVVTHDFYTRQKWKLPFRFIAQKLFLLRHIFSADLVVCQFAGYHSVLPVLFAKIFRKPSLIIVGGTDAHFFPGIAYGNWQKKYLKTATALSLKWCSHIAPKHRTLMQYEYTYDCNEPQAQGVYERLPGLKTPFTEITNGYDSEKWKCSKAKMKNSFITISGGWDFPFQTALKGIDLILAVASDFPECSFSILGVPEDKSFPSLPENVSLLPPRKNEELTAVLSQYEFYLQLSMAEGFPNALCEAMLCECIPIGSNVFSIPEIIGDSGYLLAHRDRLELKNLLQQVLNHSTFQNGKVARERIRVNYSLVKRQKALIKLCRELIEGR